MLYWLVQYFLGEIVRAKLIRKCLREHIAVVYRVLPLLSILIRFAIQRAVSEL